MQSPQKYFRSQTQACAIPECCERRKYARINDGRLSIVVRKVGLVKGLVPSECVEWLNFNRFGLAFACSRHFDVNEKVIVELKIDNIALSDLVGVIHNARRQSGKFRYGVQFYFGANGYMSSPDIEETLIQIESELK